MKKGLLDYPEISHDLDRNGVATFAEKYISTFMIDHEKGENYEKRGNHEKTEACPKR